MKFEVFHKLMTQNGLSYRIEYSEVEDLYSLTAYTLAAVSPEAEHYVKRAKFMEQGFDYILCLMLKSPWRYTYSDVPITECECRPKHVPLTEHEI